MRSYWEFPGGKLADGEEPLSALYRELTEELGIEVEASRHLATIGHEYPDLFVEIDFYVVERWRGTPTGREGQRLRWVVPDELDEGDVLPADVPVLEALRSPGN
jgi:8-oxo-dGTP diphosphatase